MFRVLATTRWMTPASRILTNLIFFFAWIVDLLWFAWTTRSVRVLFSVVIYRPFFYLYRMLYFLLYVRLPGRFLPIIEPLGHCNRHSYYFFNLSSFQFFAYEMFNLFKYKRIPLSDTSRYFHNIQNYTFEIWYDYSFHDIPTPYLKTDFTITDF